MSEKYNLGKATEPREFPARMHSVKTDATSINSIEDLKKIFSISSQSNEQKKSQPQQHPQNV
jgi:hypothetical protein